MLWLTWACQAIGACPYLERKYNQVVLELAWKYLPNLNTLITLTQTKFEQTSLAGPWRFPLPVEWNQWENRNAIDDHDFVSSFMPAPPYLQFKFHILWLKNTVAKKFWFNVTNPNNTTNSHTRKSLSRDRQCTHRLVYTPGEGRRRSCMPHTHEWSLMPYTCIRLA